MAKVITIHGDMDEELLDKRTGMDDTETDTAHWTEYWFQDELVHRSVHLYIKEGITTFGVASDFN